VPEDDDPLRQLNERLEALLVENERAARDARDAIRLREEFLSVAGHELKTPLTALLLQLQSVHDAFASGSVGHDLARWEERTGKAVAQARRLDRLVNELLDVSRITSGRLRLDRDDVDLAALVGEVVERHAPDLARAGSTATIDWSGDTVGHWDRGRLDQVITNLLSNAIKYGGGQPIRVAVSGSVDSVRLEVRDGGIGIRPEDRARVFGRFERAVSERHYGGFGLGLWIVRELVEAHGGRVASQSRSGPGSTFVVELPRVSTAAST
jgi:signal transduction histidine kinase